MGQPIANATNRAQGWRKPKYTTADKRAAGINPSGEVKTMPGDKHSKMVEGTCGGGSYRKKSASNSYRKRHDDGSRKSRRGAGGMDNKHRSPQLT